MQQHYDTFRVIGVNITAFAVSLADIETAVRIGAPLAAIIYTILKTYYMVRGEREKKRP